MIELEMVRNNHQIDPYLHIWGWEIPLYLFLGGMAAGVMVLAALLRLQLGDARLSRWARWLPLAAPTAISIGMLALFIDLANREHVHRFYLTFRPSSPMSWGAWILIGIYPATLLLAAVGLRPGERDVLCAQPMIRGLRLERPLLSVCAFARRHESAVVWWNVALGVGLGTYTGLLLGTLAARPAWGSVMLGPLFLTSGLSTGAALMMLFPISRLEHHRLRGWDVAAIVTEMILIGLFLIGLFTTGGASGRQAAQLFLGGPYTAPLWTVVVMGGLAVPLALEVIEAGRDVRPSLITPVLVLIGGLSLRWVVVLAGQAL